MNEQLLKMNGLSVEILDALSFESHLGIPLKNNLHYFDKDLLIAELVAMTEWLDAQAIRSRPKGQSHIGYCCVRSGDIRTFLFFFFLK